MLVVPNAGCIGLSGVCGVHVLSGKSDAASTCEKSKSLNRSARGANW